MAVRSLYSGDVDVTLPSKAVKNRAHAAALIERVKVYKKDYYIKVLGVPLSTQVTYKKGATNVLL